MDKAQKAWTIFQQVAPWIVVSFIPSIITGLTPYPKAKGAISWLQKLGQVLSWLEHVDAPGTFKWLVRLGALPALKS